MGERGRLARKVSDGCPARRVTLRARRPRSPALTSFPHHRGVPAQKFRRAHSAFALELYFIEGKCVFASGDNQLFIALQNFAWLAAEIDNGCGKYF